MFVYGTCPAPLLLLALTSRTIVASCPSLFIFQWLHVRQWLSTHHTLRRSPHSNFCQLLWGFDDSFTLITCPSMVTRPPHPRLLPHSNFCQLLWGFDDFMSVNGEKRCAPCRALLSDCSFCAHNCAQRQQCYFAFRSHFCERLINAAS